MAKVRRTVTLDADVERAARELAGDNFSAFVEESVRRRVKRMKLRQLLDDMEREFGPVPDDVKERVDRQWAELERSGAWG